MSLNCRRTSHVPSHLRRAAPDGYTLLQLDSDHLAAVPHLHKRCGADKVASFEPVASIFRTTFLVAVAADSKFKTLGDIVSAAQGQVRASTRPASCVSSPSPAPTGSRQGVRKALTSPCIRTNSGNANAPPRCKASKGDDIFVP